MLRKTLGHCMKYSHCLTVFLQLPLRVMISLLDIATKGSRFASSHNSQKERISLETFSSPRIFWILPNKVERSSLWSFIILAEKLNSSAAEPNFLAVKPSCLAAKVGSVCTGRVRRIVTSVLSLRSVACTREGGPELELLAARRRIVTSFWSFRSLRSLKLLPAARLRSPRAAHLSKLRLSIMGCRRIMRGGCVGDLANISCGSDSDLLVIRVL